MTQLRNTAMIRRLNTARVFQAVQRAPLASQRDIHAITGVDKATISAVVADLEAAGLIERVPRSSRLRQRSVGRPQVGLRIAASAGRFIGIRVEVSTTRAITTSLDGSVVGVREWPGECDVDALVDRIVAIVAEMAEIEAGGKTAPLCRGIGIGVPGLLDETGTVVFAPNLGWRDVPLGAMLRERLDAPIFLDNEANAGALAERRFGVCQDARTFLFVTGHSGVGGGLYLNGDLYRGGHGYAGEIGHMKVVAGGRRCGCGALGCLDAYASEQAIIATLAERAIIAPDAEAVAERARQGDPITLSVLAEAAGHLGIAISNLSHVIDPECVVLAGNFAPIAPFLETPLAASIQANTIAPLARHVNVMTSPLGADSVPMGGIALALEGFLTDGGWLNGEAEG